MIYYISAFKAFESLAKSIGKDGNYAKHLSDWQELSGNGY